MTYLFRGPYLKVPRSMQVDPIWHDDRKLARWLRASIAADKERRRLARRRSWVHPDVWSAILASFGHRCAYCGRFGVQLERDHRIPISRGGPDQPSNLVPACRPCNRRKFNHPPEDWPLLIQPVLA